MHQIFSVIAAASALTMPQTSVAANAPIAVSTCTITELVSHALMAEIVATVPVRMLRLSFVNGADAAATQVTFDVAHDGVRTTMIDRGRFSKGVPIEHLFDDVSGTYGDGGAICTVTAVTFADGRRWTAS